MLKEGDFFQHRYTIESVIGQGGFSVVYRAYDQRLKDTVAIKEFDPLSSHDEVQIKREARVTRKLRHPNIIEVYDLLWVNDIRYMIMPYLSDALDKRLKRDKALPLPEALRVMRQVCAGLNYAHTAFQEKSGIAHPIVHCDIKPANILFDDLNQVKITDFGVAHVPLIPGMVNLQADSSVYGGTIFYMAPEQLQGQQADPRIDVYAAGVLFYRILTGRFYLDFLKRRGATSENLTCICYNPPLREPLDKVGVPDYFTQVIFKALSKDPEDRYAHAGEMLTALEKKVMSEQDRMSPEPGGGVIHEPTSETPLSDEASHKPKLGLLLFLVLVLLFSLGVLGRFLVWPWMAEALSTATPVFMPTQTVPQPDIVVPTATFTVGPDATLWPTPSPAQVTSVPLTVTTPIATTVVPTPLPTLEPASCVPNPPSTWGVYTIEAGDTLAALAQRHQTTVEAIMAYNCLGDTAIRYGQELYLPVLPETPPPTPTVDLTPSPTLTPIVTKTSTVTPTITATSVPTGTPTLMPTATSVFTVTPRFAPTATPMVTPTLTLPPPPTFTPSPTPTSVPITATLPTSRTLSQ